MTHESFVFTGTFTDSSLKYLASYLKERTDKLLLCYCCSRCICRNMVIKAPPSPQRQDRIECLLLSLYTCTTLVKVTPAKQHPIYFMKVANPALSCLCNSHDLQPIRPILENIAYRNIRMHLTRTITSHFFFYGQGQGILFFAAVPWVAAGGEK